MTTWTAPVAALALVLGFLTFLLAFAGSHVLARAIGAWPAVLAVAAVTLLVVSALDRQRGAAGSRAG